MQLETGHEPWNMELYWVDGGVRSYQGAPKNLPAQPYYTLFFVLEGRARLYLESVVHEIHKEDIFVLYPDRPALLQGEGLRCVQITLGGDSVATYLEYVGFHPKEPVQTSHIPCERYLAQVEDTLLASNHTLVGHLQQTSHLYSLFSILVDAQRVEGQSGVARYDYPQEVYVDTLKEHISRQYSYIRISDIANSIGVNRSYLTVIFKKVTGMSPQSYLMQFRMEKACELLESTEQPLREIARRVGYADPFTFSKTFKTQYGISPSAYRRQKEGESGGKKK